MQYGVSHWQGFRGGLGMHASFLSSHNTLARIVVFIRFRFLRDPHYGLEDRGKRQLFRGSLAVGCWLHLIWPRKEGLHN